MTNYTKTLAEFAAKLKYEDIPAKAVEMVKLITLHTIGVSIAGSGTSTTTGARLPAERKGGVAQATVWGGSGKIPADEAAYVNGVAADALDWEDCTWTGHASAGAIPAGFAVSEMENSTGKAYIEAIVAAYEVYQRVAMSVQPELQAQVANTGKGRGWGLVNYNIFAAGVAAAKLKGFDPAMMAKNISVDAYMVPMCIAKTGGTDLYHCGHGAVAKSAVANLDIAQATEHFEDGLDGPNAYWRQISDQVDWDWMLKGLGEDWLICETLLKHWPANIWLQGPLECLDLIYKKHSFTPADVEHIHICPKIDIVNNPKPRPYSLLNAQYSIPHCFAAYLEQPEPNASWFRKETLDADSPFGWINPLIQVDGEDINRYVAFRVFMERTFPPTRVDITLKDGTVLTEELRHPKGHPRNQFSLKEEHDFFVRITSDFIGRDKAEAFADAICDLENCPSMTELGKYLTAK